MLALTTIAFVLNTVLSLALVAKSSPNPVKRQTQNPCDFYPQCRFVNSFLTPPNSCQTSSIGCCRPNFLLAMVDCYKCYYDVQFTDSGQPPDMSQAQIGVDGLYNTCRMSGKRITVSVDAFTLPGQDVNRNTVDRGINPNAATPSVSPQPTPVTGAVRSTITVVVDPTAAVPVPAGRGGACGLKVLPLESLLLMGLAFIVTVMF